MKKNIIIGVLAVITLSSIAWGLTRQIEATRQEQISLECAKMAKEQMVVAEHERARAEMARIVAEEATIRAREAVQIATIEAVKAR